MFKEKIYFKDTFFVNQCELKSVQLSRMHTLKYFKNPLADQSETNMEFSKRYTCPVSAVDEIICKGLK